MKTKEALNQIIGMCDSVDDLEINVTAGGIEIYWENLRIFGNAKTVIKALKAIRKLNKLGVYFQ